MNDAINAREAALKEVIKINNEDIAYLNNRAKNAETELDQVKRDNEKLEKENKKLREENEMLRCSKGGTPEKVGHEEMIQYLMEENKNLRDINRELQRWLEQTEDILKFQQEENKKLKKENEELKEYKLMYEGLIN